MSPLHSLLLAFTTSIILGCKTTNQAFELTGNLEDSRKLLSKAFHYREDQADKLWMRILQKDPVSFVSEDGQTAILTFHDLFATNEAVYLESLTNQTVSIVAKDCLKWSGKQLHYLKNCVSSSINLPNKPHLQLITAEIRSNLLASIEKDLRELEMFTESGTIQANQIITARMVSFYKLLKQKEEINFSEDSFKKKSYYVHGALGEFVIFSIFQSKHSVGAETNSTLKLEYASSSLDPNRTLYLFKKGIIEALEKKLSSANHNGLTSIHFEDFSYKRKLARGRTISAINTQSELFLALKDDFHHASVKFNLGINEYSNYSPIFYFDTLSSLILGLHSTF